VARQQRRHFDRSIVELSVQLYIAKSVSLFVFFA